MHTDELMRLTVDKALSEFDWDSIEFLFKPTNMGALLLRLDFEGMRNKVNEAFGTNDPCAMPHRFRHQYWPAWYRAIQLEEFYTELKKEHDKRTTPN